MWWWWFTGLDRMDRREIAVPRGRRVPEDHKVHKVPLVSKEHKVALDHKVHRAELDHRGRRACMARLAASGHREA